MLKSNWWIVSPCGWVPIRWEVGKISEGKARMFTTCLNWFVGEIGVDYFSPMNPSMRPWSWSSMFQGNLDLASGAQMASIILAPLYRLHDPFGNLFQLNYIALSYICHFFQFMLVFSLHREMMLRCLQARVREAKGRIKKDGLGEARTQGELAKSARWCPTSDRAGGANQLCTYYNILQPLPLCSLHVIWSSRMLYNKQSVEV